MLQFIKEILINFACCFPPLLVEEIQGCDPDAVNFCYFFHLLLLSLLFYHLEIKMPKKEVTIVVVL